MSLKSQAIVRLDICTTVCTTKITDRTSIISAIHQSDGNITIVAHNLAFAQKKKGDISGHLHLLSCVLGQKKGGKKTCAQTWYARKSGNSPGAIR